VDKKDAIIEYDRYYRKKPTKWESEERDEYCRKRIEEFLEYTPRVVLDIGCGNGHTIAYLQKSWLSAKYYGFDLSPAAIEIAKTKVPGANFKVMFLDEADYKIRFECILLLGVVEHFEKLHESLVQVNNLLTPSGIVYIEAPNCLAYETSTPEEGFRRVNFGNRQMEWHLSRDSWVKHFKAAGFEVAASIIGPTPQTEFIFILEQ
jgi:trans-aconitate methyltransferase